MCFVFFASVMALLCEGAQAQTTEAQTTEAQWWPELDSYVDLTQRLRLLFTAERYTDGGDYNSIQFGPYLEIGLRPLLRKRLITNDWAKHNYLVLQIGYQHRSNFDKPDEERGVLSLTLRYPLPGSLMLADRNQSDLRWTNGVFTWRYRNRLMLERSFKIKRVTLTPFARDEVYYDSKYGVWNLNTYAFGSSIPVRKRVEIELHYERDHNTRASPTYINALEFTLSLFLRRK